MMFPTILLMWSIQTFAMIPDNSTLVLETKQFAEATGIGEIPVKELAFKQAWLTEPTDDFLPGVALLYPTQDTLDIVMTMADTCIHSDADGFNQLTWTLGDVVEIFIANVDSERYWELHVSPDNHRTQLYWTPKDLDTFRSKEKPVEDFMNDNPDLIESQVRVSQEANLWQVHVKIPWSIIDYSPGQETYAINLAICRYDATPGIERAVLSSTANLKKPSFHRRAEWDTLILNSIHTPHK